MLKIKTRSKKILEIFKGVRGVTVEPSEDGLTKVYLEGSSLSRKSALEALFSEIAYVNYWLEFERLRQKRDFNGMLKVAVSYYRPRRGWGRGLDLTRMNKNFETYEPRLVDGEEVWTLHKLLDICRRKSRVPN